MQALGGFVVGLLVCALVWLHGEWAERAYRIQRARRRDHSKVPALVASSQDQRSYTDLAAHG